VKIRLHGAKEECRELAGRLPAITDVLSVSDPYPDRGTSRMVRIYIEVRPYPGEGPHVTVTSEQTSRPDQRASALAQRMLSGRRRAIPPGDDR
jgi:hypothetical protein